MNDRKEPTPPPDESTKPMPPPAPPSHDTEVALEEAPAKAGSGPDPEHFGDTQVPNAVEVYQQGMRSGFIPIKLRDFREAWQFAAVLVKSELLPKDVNTPGKALAIMLTGQEIGVPTMAALRTIHVVDGRPTLGAELMLAKFNMAGGSYKILEHTHDTCRIRFEYKGNSYTSEWTPEDTKLAGLKQQTARGKVRENWIKYEKRMVLWRAVDNGLSIVCPEIFLGLHTAAYAYEAVEYEEADVGQDNMESRIADLNAAIEAGKAEITPPEEALEEQAADEDLGLCETCDKPMTKDNRANEKICLDCAEGIDA